MVVHLSLRHCTCVRWCYRKKLRLTPDHCVTLPSENLEVSCAYFGVATQYRSDSLVAIAVGFGSVWDLASLALFPDSSYLAWEWGWDKPCYQGPAFQLRSACEVMEAIFLTADNGFLDCLESLLTNRRAEEHHTLLTWTVQVRATIVYWKFTVCTIVYWKLLCVL